MSEETELYLATESVGTATLFFGGEPVWDEPPGKWCYGPKSIECWVLSTRPQAAPSPGAAPVRVVLVEAAVAKCQAEAVELLRLYASARTDSALWRDVHHYREYDDAVDAVLARHDDAKGTVTDG
ncbi:MAG TPA: hypothetical protein VMZ06_01105 [Candidatus Bathyarchaeia archaeon]|nr:hypothetical protein [Candidatus Bathyarchaeia archaeon]